MIDNGRRLAAENRKVGTTLNSARNYEEISYERK